MPEEIEDLYNKIKANAFIDFPLFTIACIILIIFCTVRIRRRHSSKIYTAWYVFSLSLYINFVIASYLLLHGQLIPPIPYNFDKLNWYLEAVASIKGEIYLLLFVAGLCIIPQFISYVISGIFGCGSTPLFVTAVYRFFVWSLIKFFSFLAGLLCSVGFTKLFIETRNYQDKMEYTIDICSYFIEALFIQAVALLIMDVYYMIETISTDVPRRLNQRWIITIHRRMTRFKTG